MVRNRIAHCSRHSRTKFEDFVRQELGHVPISRPGELLSAKFATNQTYFEHYSNILKGLGKFIVK